MRLAILCVVFIAFPLSAQINALGFIGVNPPTNFLADGKFLDRLNSDWKPGLTVGVAGEFFITSFIAGSLSAEYAYYAFDSYTVGASIPEWHLISASGEPASAWRVFLEGELFSQKAKVLRVYVSTGVGYLSEKLGNVTITSYDDQDNTQGTGIFPHERTSCFVHTAGLGLRFSILEQLGADLKGQYFTDYDGRMQTSFKASLVYTFTE